MRLTEHEQRLLDQQTGLELDRAAARRRIKSWEVCAVADCQRSMDKVIDCTRDDCPHSKEAKP
jgi:hypothetical protein